MPRYFFHVHDHQFLPDDTGTELPDLASAQRQAVKLAGVLLNDHADEFWTGADWRLEVEDESGQRLFVLEFTATLSPSVTGASAQVRPGRGEEPPPA